MPWSRHCNGCRGELVGLFLYWGSLWLSVEKGGVVPPSCPIPYGSIRSCVGCEKNDNSKCRYFHPALPFAEFLTLEERVDILEQCKRADGLEQCKIDDAIDVVLREMQNEINELKESITKKENIWMQTNDIKF